MWQSQNPVFWNLRSVLHLRHHNDLSSGLYTYPNSVPLKGGNGEKLSQLNDLYTHDGAYWKPELTEFFPAISKHHGVFLIYNTEVKIVVISLVIPNTTWLIHQYNKASLG